MIQLIVGGKGSGKTKKMIDMINDSAKTTPGNIVCLSLIHILEAAKRSKYADRLQLVFAGKGPKEKAYRKLAAGLAHPPVFGFYGQDELRRLINMLSLIHI